MSCDDSLAVMVDSTEYTHDYYVYSNEPRDSVALEIFDTQGVSKDMILCAVTEKTVAKNLWVTGNPNLSEAEINALRENIKWGINNAKSIKFMIDGKEVTDLSKISFDNGDVTIDLVVDYVLA